MKFPALVITSLALTACSATTSQQSAPSALSAVEALDLAAVPSTNAPKIEPAKSQPELKKKPTADTAMAAPASADATCARGPLDAERSFIICEDGALRKAGVMAALSAPHDPDLKIEDVAASYQVPSQVFTGLQNATYGTLVSAERRAPRPAGKHKAKTGLVQIEGKVYEVYQLGTAGKTGTIFVEKKKTQAE